MSQRFGRAGTSAAAQDPANRTGEASHGNEDLYPGSGRRARDARRGAAVVGARRRQRGAADGGAGRDRGEHRAAVGAARAGVLRRGPPVGRDRLCAGVRQLAADRREAVRPARPQPHLHGRAGRVRRRLRAGRGGAELRGPGRRPGRPGRVRGAARAGRAGDRHGDVRRQPGPRPRVRDLRRRRRDRRRGRLATRRAADRAPELALDAVRQPGLRRHRADRGGGRPAHRPTIDLPGTVLVSAGLFLLVFGLSRAQAGGWHAPASWLSLTGAAALLAAFAGWQTRAAAPLLPLRVLADRDRAASIIALTLASAGIYSVFLFLTYYLQTVQAYTPVRTGLAFLPMVATTITGAVLGANVLLTRIGPRLTLPLGMLASAAGMAWLTRLTVTSSYPGAVLGPLLILGLGLGLIFAPAISLGTARLRGQDTGVGSALVNTTQQVGGAVGIALLSTLAASATASYLRPHAAITPALLQHAAVHGYTIAYWTATAIFTAGALLTALLYRSGRTDPAVLASTVPA